jgi:hypothetical protein
LPTFIKKKEWFLLAENVVLYTLFGVMFGVSGLIFTWTDTVFFAFMIVFEAWLYYTNSFDRVIKRVMKKSIKNNPLQKGGSQAVVSYLFLQAHGIGFMVIGYATGLLMYNLGIL